MLSKSSLSVIFSDRSANLGRILIAFCRFASTTMARPNVFFDMNIGGQPAGRIVFEVSVLKLGPVI